MGHSEQQASRQRCSVAAADVWEEIELKCAGEAEQ
jgi:hypothetical protein